jgi:hypothetical protein
VTDIFHEVEEEVRRERFEKLWKEYGDYIVAAAAFVVIGAAGWQLWRYYEHREVLRASNEYIAAQQVLESGQLPAAGEAFGKLAASAPSGYTQVARLQEAGALQASGRTDDAVKLYMEVANGGDEVLAGVARIRAAWATADTASRSALQTTLGSTLDPSSAWNTMAREILAYSDFRSGNTKAAADAYKRLSTEKSLPESMHQRIAAMATFLSAGGAQNFGTMPPPPAPPKAPAQASAPAPTPQGPQEK